MFWFLAYSTGSTMWIRRLLYTRVTWRQARAPIPSAGGKVRGGAMLRWPRSRGRGPQLITHDKFACRSCRRGRSRRSFTSPAPQTATAPALPPPIPTYWLPELFCIRWETGHCFTNKAVHYCQNIKWTTYGNFLSPFQSSSKDSFRLLHNCGTKSRLKSDILCR